MDDDRSTGASSDAMFRVVVETSQYLYAIVRDDLSLAYVNPAVLDILGYDPDEVLGRSATDIIHPDDFDIALGALTELVEEYDARPGGGVPMPVRLIRADGSLALVELGAVPCLDDPDVGGTIIRGRPMAGQRSLDDALEALVGSSPLDKVLEYLVISLEHELRGARAAIGHGWDGEAFESIVAPRLPVVLSGGGTARGDEPWSIAMRTGRPEAVATADDLPADLADLARRQGFESCWVSPVVDTSNDTPVAAVIVWRAAPGLPLVSHDVAMRRAGRLTKLSLERHRAERLLRHAALHDNLTGVANRSQFFLRLQELTGPHGIVAPEEAASRPGRGALLAVLYLDLDDFKPVNDTHGHGHGDDLLRVVTSRIEATVRPDDLVARLGGDEFAVICPDVSDGSMATSIAERLIREVARPIDLAGVTVRVGLSVGVAVGDRAVGDGPQLLAAADSALYAAKRAGKGQWRLAP